MNTLSIKVSAMYQKYTFVWQRILLDALFLLMLTVALPAFAAQVSGLYDAEVLTEGQEIVQRNSAIAEAFRQVLVKVTGNQGIIHHPRLAGEISSASRYVQQYRYRMVTLEEPVAPVVEPSVESEGAAVVPAYFKQARMLRVTFDEQAVNRMLRQYGIAVWGGMRPATLVWLAIEQDGRRSLATLDADEQSYSGIFNVMETRGIPILLPLMDLEDQTNLQVSDIWGGFADAIWRASERYGADAVMTARLVQFNSELWRAGWTLLLEGKEFLWDSEGDSLAMAVEVGVHAGMDLLASIYAPTAVDNNIGVLYLRIAGVHDLYSYAKLQRYLAGQDVVEQLSLTFVEPEAVTYALHVRGGQRALEQGISLSSILFPDRSEVIQSQASAAVSSEVMVDSEASVLRYRLQP